MTYRVCEDAPCCGCCGTSLYGTNESDQGYYDEPDYFLNEGVYRDLDAEDEWDDEDSFDPMEDQWLDGSYEE